jgi:hypothetical protein
VRGGSHFADGLLQGAREVREAVDGSYGCWMLGWVDDIASWLVGAKLWLLAGEL